MSMNEGMPAKLIVSEILSTQEFNIHAIVHLKKNSSQEILNLRRKVETRSILGKDYLAHYLINSPQLH